VNLLRALPLLLAAAPLAAAPGISDAPVKNFLLKIFTKEGVLSHVVKGSEARYLGPDLIDVTEMNIAFYSAANPSRAETILLSPRASFLPATNLARGQKAVRIIRDDLEASGTKWSYAQKEKRISLDQNVRVVFQAELKDLLK